MESNTRPDIPFSVIQCIWFTHNTKASHEMALKRICWCLLGIKDKSPALNPSKIMVMDCYIYADFVRLWGHDNPRDAICDKEEDCMCCNFSLLSSVVGIKDSEIYCSF